MISIVILGIAPEISPQISGPILGHNITAIAVAPGGNPVYVGTFKNGVFRIDADTGETEAMNEGLDYLGVRSLVIDPFNASRIYFSSGSGIYRSDDGGNSWTKIRKNITNEVWISPLNSDLLLSQSFTGYAYRSDDGGNQWLGLGNPFTDYGGNLLTKLIAKKDGSAIFAAHDDLGIDRSRDGGQTWEKMIPKGRTLAMALSADDRVLYIGSGMYASDENRVVVDRSLDEGDAWEGLEYSTNVTDEGGFPWGITIHLFADPNVPNVLYVITSEGLFYTIDGGATWGNLTDLLKPFGTVLAVDQERSRLYIGSI